MEYKVIEPKGGEDMFHANIKELSKENENYRKVVYTGEMSQVVLMSLQPGEDIGMETHQMADQILFFVDGHGQANVGNKTENIKKSDVVFVPAGTAHNFTNTGDEPLKLYTIYAPPVHRDGLVVKTKSDALEEKEAEIYFAESQAEDAFENM